MNAHRIAGWLIVAILCAVPSVGVAAPTFAELLQQADKVRSSNPQQFQMLLRQLDAMSQQAEPAQRQHLRLLHAYASAYSGKYDIAIEQAKPLFDEASDINVKFRAGLLIANSYAINRDFGEGLRSLDRTLPLRDQVTDPDLRQDGLSVAVVLYNQLGQYELGRSFAEQILAGSPSPRGRCFAGHLRIEALYNLKAMPVSDEPLKQIIDLCYGQGELVMTNLARTYLARKWADEGKLKNAIALLDRYMWEVEDTRYPRLIGEAHSLLAEYRLAVGDLTTAEQHARKAIAQSAGIAYSLPLVMAYKTLYEIDVRRQDNAAALEHYRAYAEADKAYLNDIKARELAFQLARHETLQKTQQIELLNRKNEVLQLQQRVDKQATQNTQLLAVLLAVLLASIGYWAYKTKRMQMSFRRLAETDALTGISNRHHFTRQAEEALAYCAKTGEDVGVIMFDLDNFKSVNDRFGHVAGDCVLQRVAAACKSQCRKNDRFGRLGGEEFALLLIGCDLQAATQMAQTCRARVAEIDTTECGSQFQVTASFGVTAASLSGYEFTRLLSHADQMLYRSKRAGRNRVSAFSAEALDTVFVPDAAVVEHRA